MLCPYIASRGHNNLEFEQGLGNCVPWSARTMQFLSELKDFTRRRQLIWGEKVNLLKQPRLVFQFHFFHERYHANLGCTGITIGLSDLQVLKSVFTMQHV